MDIEHTADRPSWNCRACAAAWPCAPAQDRLLAELTETPLRMYAWAMLEDAAGDLPTLTGPELSARFMAWTRVERRPDPGRLII